MKTIKIILQDLAVDKADLRIGHELKALKLSFEQAMSYEKTFSSFEEMCQHYPDANVLQEGEYYHGYLLIFYSARHQQIVYLNGMLNKCTDEEKHHDDDIAIRDAAHNGILYEISHPSHHVKGHCDNIWSFGKCSYASTVVEMQRHQGLSININAKKTEKNLKEKLKAALLNHSFTCELTDEEYTVLMHHCPSRNSMFTLIE